MRLAVVSLRSLVRLAFITEGKVEDLTVAHPNIAVAPLAVGDPSPTKKYLEWMVKQAGAGNKEEDIIPTVRYFHDNAHKFPSKDINAYKTLKDLEDAAKAASEKKTKGEVKREISSNEAPKIYEDDTLLMVRLDTKRACVKYGKGTKWCITMEDAGYYEQYTGANVVFYFIFMKVPVENKDNEKFALAIMRDAKNNVTTWDMYDAADKQVTTNIFIRNKKLKAGLGASSQEAMLTRSLVEALEAAKADAAAQPKSLLAKLGSGDAVPPEEIVAYWKTLGEGGPGTEPFTVKCAMLGSMYDNARQSGDKAAKRVIKALGVLAEHETDADLHDALVAGASGKQWMDFDGGIQYHDLDGEYHRAGDKPAIITTAGERQWWKHGKLHRDGDKPAQVDVDGSEFWFHEGERHRERGPAMIVTNGSPDGHFERYFLFGKALTKPAWEKKVALLQSAAAKKKRK